MNPDKKKLAILIIVLALSAVAPNLFPIAESGSGNLSKMAISYFIPSAALTLLLTGLAYMLHYRDVSAQLTNGIIGGLIGTIGLEIVREIGFHLGGMPGDLPKLIGVLLLDRFASGPNALSDIAGWAYHFWTGAAFGVIYSVLFGHAKTWWGILYGVLLGLGFMISPVPVALGIGKFGLEFKDGYQFMLTVTLAHIAFGAILGWYVSLKNKDDVSIFRRFRHIFMS